MDAPALFVPINYEIIQAKAMLADDEVLSATTAFGEKFCSPRSPDLMLEFETAIFAANGSQAWQSKIAECLLFAMVAERGETGKKMDCTSEAIAGSSPG